MKLDDIFDVEAPEVGAPRWDMSPLKAYHVALSSERKAFAFYDQALRYVSQPDVRLCSRNCGPRRPSTCR